MKIALTWRKQLVDFAGEKAVEIQESLLPVETPVESTSLDDFRSAPMKLNPLRTGFPAGDYGSKRLEFIPGEGLKAVGL